jgi:hypothetical protein
MAPRARFELATLRLTAECSTVELPGNGRQRIAFELRRVYASFRIPANLRFPGRKRRSNFQNRGRASLQFRYADFFCILYTIESRRGLKNNGKTEVQVNSRKKFDVRTIFLLVFLIAPIFLAIGAGGCSSPKPAAEQPASAQPAAGPKRYPLTGRVVSINKPKLQVTVDAADIPDFMSAMTMGYDVKSADALDPLSAEDQIKADVVVNGNDVHLENIVVTKKADPSKAPAAGTATPKPDKK